VTLYDEKLKLPGMNRYRDWAPRLNAYLIEVQGNQFELGVFDCCTFAAGAIEAMTGVDHMAEFRGAYDSWESSDEALQTLGAGDLLSTLTEKFGEPVPGCRGIKGDLCWFEGGLGIVLGVYAIFLSDQGLAYLKLSRLEYCFKVPE
jgi:hypothetical protein